MKDAIDRILLHRNNQIDILGFCKKTWSDFENAAVGKTVILFGIGQGAEFYYYKYGERSIVDRVIDSDVEKQGHEVQEFLWEQIDVAHKGIKIESVEILNDFLPDDIVVLIASLRYYNEIADILGKHSIKNYFSVLCMEALYREKHYNSMPETSKARFIRNVVKLPVDRKKVFLYTEFEGAGHAKEVVRNLLAMGKDLTVVWFVENVKNNQVMLPGVKTVSLAYLREYMYELSTAYIWLIDNGIPNVLPKRRDQICIQLNHWASVTLKMFGYDLARFRNDKGLLETMDTLRKVIDYIMVGSKFDEETSRRGFGFSGEVFYAGSPRSDILFNPEPTAQVIYKIYPMFRGFKLLLYSPTFRVRASDAYNIIADNIDLDFAAAKAILERRFGGQWLILLRLHPVVASSSKDIPHPDFVIDVSDYYDSEELVAASDAMITDYSSIMFEPAFVHKPVFLLATDREQYIEEERGFLIDYDTLPFPRASSNEELARNIESFDEEKYVRDVDAFLDKYGVHEDGHAGERAAKFILDLIDGKRG